MANDAPAEQFRRVPEEQHQALDKPTLDAARTSLLEKDDPSYRGAFARDSNEIADKRVVELGFRKGTDVANFKDAGEAGKDCSDRFKGISEKQAVSDYCSTLQRSGFSQAEAEGLAQKSLDRFEAIKGGGESHLEGTAAEQMARLNKSMTDILDKTGVRDGKLVDGQQDKLTDTARKNLVKDLASRCADPDRFAVQGDHFSCVLQSRQKQLLEGGDISRVAEMTASVVNNGSAEVKQLDGTSRTVHVDSQSFKPDNESRVAFNATTHGDLGKRGMAGHVWDALAGQTLADLKSERMPGGVTSAEGIEKATHVYMAAHSEKYGASTSTGEGLFKKSGGGYSLKEDNPGAALWDIAHLNRAMGGQDGAVFVHQNLAGSDQPPAGKGFPDDLRVTTFSSMKDLHDKLQGFQNKAGQSAQIIVDAPFLPGGGANGHGLHAMNISLNGDNSFKLDNNWSSDKDLGKVTDAQVERATNPDKWSPLGRPNSETIFRPDSGRNPNETQADADTRHSEDAKRKEAEQDEDRKKQEERRKKEEKEAAEKQKHEEEKLSKESKEQHELYVKQLRMQKDLAEQEERERAEKLVSHHINPSVSVW